MVFLSSRISPFTSTVIFRDRSPACTALVTSAMFLTCEVRLPALQCTDSARAPPAPLPPRPRPPPPAARAAAPTVPAVPARAAHHLAGERSQLVHHRVDGV